MTNKKTEGVFIRKNRTFYYLETGDIVTRSAIDRIRNILIQRDLLTYHRENANDLEPDHKVMTLGDAENANVTIERIFLNKHIERIFKEKKSTETTSPWAI